MCLVNVQHNCQSHSCDTSGMKAVHQERELTTTVISTVHHRNPDDLLLNTCQMRNAVDIQPLRCIPAELDRGQAILFGAMAEVDSRKKSDGSVTVRGQGGRGGRGSNAQGVRNKGGGGVGSGCGERSEEPGQGMGRGSGRGSRGVITAAGAGDRGRHGRRLPAG